MRYEIIERIDAFVTDIKKGTVKKKKKVFEKAKKNNAYSYVKYIKET